MSLQYHLNRLNLTSEENQRESKRIKENQTVYVIGVLTSQKQSLQFYKNINNQIWGMLRDLK
jgi:hypothetical protein